MQGPVGDQSYMEKGTIAQEIRVSNQGEIYRGKHEQLRMDRGYPSQSCNRP